MSAARDFLADLDRHGVRIVPIGDGLRLVPPTGRPVPPDLVARGRQLKPALLELLRQPSRQIVHTTSAAENLAHSSDADDVAEAYAERQAICETDGRLKRTEAALLAAACTIPLRDGESAESREDTVLHFAEHLERHRRRREAKSRNGGSAA